MSKLVEGVHHIALKALPEKFDEVVAFYTKLLEMEVARSWGEGDKRGSNQAFCPADKPGR